MPGERDPRWTAADPSTRSAPPRPGALTALLAELVRAPEVAGWELPLGQGDLVGRFEIVRELGRGGFGVVYEALDRELSRSVAFKAIRAGATPAAESRAIAEAEAAARLAHPNIVHLYDLGRSERGAWLIMELLRGRSLAERVREGPLPLRELVQVAVEISRGVAHAHAQGVVHRDLKPSNVFLCEDGQVKVLDFGLAQVFGKAGVAGGTPGYMAAEQAAGEPGDERSDVYSLGVMLRELLTGELPTGTRPASGEGSEPGPAGGTAALKSVPAALARLVARMTARDTAARPANGAEVHAALLAIQKSLEPRPLLWAGWGLAVVAVLAAAGFALWYRPLAPGRLLTALADTDNQTGDPDLDGLSELLRSGLDQSKRLSVMARSRLVNAIRAAGAATPRTLREAEAGPVAQQAQAKLLMVPAVRPSPSGYDVSIRTVDLARQETLFTHRETAGNKATIPDALERLQARVRRSVKEEAREAPKAPVSVADLAPANPEALRLFSDARRQESEGRYDEAMAAYRKAAEADPAFLLARLAVLENNGAQYLPDDELEQHRRVLREGLHRLPEKERYFAERAVLSFGEFRNLTEEIQRIDQAIEAWPEDPAAYEWAGNLLLQQRADLEAARPYLERAVAIAGLSEGAAIDFLLALGRYDDALARARRWTEETPNWLSFNNLHLAHQHRGEFRESVEALRRSLSLGAHTGGALLPFLNVDAIEEAEEIYRQAGPSMHWLAARGRVREAVALRAAKAPKPDAHYGHHINWTFFGSYFLLAREDPEATWRETRALFEVGYGFYACHALQLALLGDLERAWRLSVSKSADGLVCHRQHMAVRLWKRGDREGALQAFAAIWAPSSHVYRGQILAELGRHREAVEELRLYRRRRGLSIWDGNFDKWNYPRSLYFEAASLEALGEREAAKEMLGRLLRLWDRADPELPLLRNAKALQTRLAGARP